VFIWVIALGGILKMPGRMFKFITKTWNPVVGCDFYCKYCWARRQARRMIHICEKCGNFIPHLHEERLSKVPKKGLIFVCDMGDLFSYSIKDEWILKVLDTIRKVQTADFFLETKNPERYFDFIDVMPENVILSTTIETNRNYNFSKAPPVEERYKAMKNLKWHKKHISIEPIMDFDIVKLTAWILQIKPLFVSVGYDNYNNKLPEPPLQKVQTLIEILEKNNIEVERKTLRDPCRR